MADFKNEFSWSKSRDNIFKKCKRKYFFNHYGFWNGWAANEDDRVKRIYYLKKLSAKELWLGSLVHEVVEFTLRRFRAGSPISLNHALSIMRKRFDNDFEISKLKEYTGFKSSAHRFFEDEYNIEISDEKRRELFEKGQLCIRNFFNSDTFMDIRQGKIEDWITLEDFLSFNFEGTRIFLKIDFAMRVGDKIILFDWKTGAERRADFDLQLSLYALYMSEKFNIPATKIETHIFNLAINKVDSFKIDEEKLKTMRKYIHDSILEMKNLLRDTSRNEATEEDFEKNKGFWCNRCNFRKVCDKTVFPKWNL